MCASVQLVALAKGLVADASKEEGSIRPDLT
jgi:hypothetical protein